jgi:hypothetical protein
MEVLWNSYDESYDNLMGTFYLKTDLSHKIFLRKWPLFFKREDNFHFIYHIYQLLKTKLQLTDNKQQEMHHHFIFAYSIFDCFIRSYADWFVFVCLLSPEQFFIYPATLTITGEGLQLSIFGFQQWNFCYAPSPTVIQTSVFKVIFESSRFYMSNPSEVAIKTYFKQGRIWTSWVWLVTDPRGTPTYNLSITWQEFYHWAAANGILV